VPVRVSPTDRIRHHIDELFAQDRPLPEILEEVARLGAQLLMQAALEAEVTGFLGRDRYQRAALTGDARPGSRNGYREVTVKTTAGPVTLARPKLRGTTEAFASRLFGSHVTKTNALESLVIASFVRGLSVRDVQATLADALGDQAAVSKSTVSAICQAIKDEYQAWAGRRLEEVTLDYLFLDASFFRMHPGSPAEPVLAAWGITTDGKPAFVGLAPGTGESFDAWKDFLTDLKERGLASPLLVISDGAPGLIGAIEQIYPKALRQRCLVHRNCKDSTCCVMGCGVRRGCRGGEQVAAGAIAGCGWRGDMPGLVEEREGFADGIADRGPADTEEAGQHVHRAQVPLVEDGQQDAFTVADLLVEDAAAGGGLAGAAAPLVAEAFGLGGLQRCELPGEVLQAGAAEPGQRRMGELFGDLGALGAGVAVEEGAKRLCGGKAGGRRAGGVAVVLEDFAGFSDQVTDAGGGDFEQVGEHVHGACLPLVEEGEQDAGGIVEQRLAAAYLAAGPAGPAATLLAVALLGAGCLTRGQRGAQAGEAGAGHPGQPLIVELGQHLLAAAGRAGALTGGAFADGGGGCRRVEGVVPGAVGGVPLQRQGGEALLADRHAGGVVAGV
jgi:hypothetical protein